MLPNQPKTKPTYLYTSIPVMYFAESTGWSTRFWESTTFWTDLKCCSFTTSAPRTFWSTAPWHSSSRHPGLGLELVLHQAQNVVPLSRHFFLLWHPCVSTLLKQNTCGPAQRSVSGDVCDRSLHPTLKEGKKRVSGYRRVPLHPCVSSTSLLGWSDSTPLTTCNKWNYTVHFSSGSISSTRNENNNRNLWFL